MTADDAGARRLLAALLLRAAHDAEDPDPFLATEARRYLEGEGCDAAEMLDIRPARVRAWLEGLAEVEKELGQCTYADWQVAELLGVSKSALQKLRAAGILVPDAPGGKYSAVALLEFLGKGDEQGGS